MNFIRDHRDIKMSRALLKLNINNEGEYSISTTFEEKNNLEMPWVSLRHLKIKNIRAVQTINIGVLIECRRHHKIRTDKVENKRD